METEEIALNLTSSLLGIEISSTQIQAQIENHVLYLLENDFNALVNLLYKIDVDEQKSKACFGQESSLVANCLAKLIWGRQNQKAELRKKFSS